MKTVAFKEEEFQMVQVLLQNHLDSLTEDEFFTQSATVKKSIYRDENVCMKAITAMKQPIADQYYDLGTQSD
tara:strand:+ start:285 stop:500 length:216 start_codon:yes stop_codon:yes gene_type:complete